MFQNYLKTSLRALRRNKAHASINILGLTLGLLCAILIFQLVRFELSFGTDVPDPDEVHRVYREEFEYGERDFGVGIPYPFFDAFRADFPDIPAFTLLDDNMGSPLVTIIRDNGERVRFEEEDAGSGFVDSTFFEVFPRTWLAGDPATALAKPNSVVLSASLAQKYFDEPLPIGKQLTYDNRVEFTVTGVVNDSPVYSNVPLDLIFTANMGPDSRGQNGHWGSISSGVQAYMRLPENMTAESVEARFVDFLAKHRDTEDGAEVTLHLQPLLDMHFSDVLNSKTYTTPKETIWAFSLIGLFLLLTACINFVNLNTVLVFKRAKEVGVRKMLGGTRAHIINYFMTETGLITIISLVLALGFAVPGLELIRTMTDVEATISLLDPVLLGVGLLMASALMLLSGLYPSFLLARLEPAIAVKGKSTQKPGSFLSLRRGLVVFQFAISQVLIIATLVAALQMQHLYDMPLGYDTEAIVEFYLPVQDQAIHETLRNELVSSPNISNVTFSNSGATSGSTWAGGFDYEIDGEQREQETQVKFVDMNYIETYGMNLLAGQHFPHDDSSSGFIINEAMVDLMGFATPEEALGVPISLWGNDNQVIGVLQNFNTNSLHRPISPTILVTQRDSKYFAAIKLSTRNYGNAITEIQQAYEAAFPAFVFDYRYLDERIRDFYEGERDLQNLLQMFAFVAILIGCIGLFGLISYTTTQRQKEVGVRKVLGASVSQIISLFTREFVVMVALGFLISAPLGYFGMRAWLQDFAYQIDLGVVVFALAFFVSLAIALLTVGYRTWRTAIANPVDAIKYE